MIISNSLSKINVDFLTCRNSIFSFYTKQFHFYEIINIFFKFLNSKSSTRNPSSTTSSTKEQDYGRSKSLEQPKRIAFPKSVTFNREGRSRSISARQTDQDSPLLKSMLQSDKSNIGVSYCRSHFCTLRNLIGCAR